MCEPTTIAMLAIAAAGAVMQAQAQDQMAEDNRRAAEASYKAQMDALELQRKQTDEQATDKKSEVAEAEQARMAQLRVAAGESGVSGISVDRAEGEIAQDEAHDIAAIEANRRYAAKQSSAQAAGLAAQKMGQINSVQRANWGATALQIGGAAVGSYDKYQTKQALLSAKGSGLQSGG